MNIFPKTLAMLVATVAASGCVVADGSAAGAGGNFPSPAGRAEYVQTIIITTINGNREKLVQSFAANGVQPGYTRVCLFNRKGGKRSLTHNQNTGNIHLHAGAHANVCATFRSDARVTFTPWTNRDRATPSKTLVYSFARYEGGTLNLTWK